MFVVLLMAAFSDKFKNPAREIGLRIHMGDRNIGDVFPGLIRNAGNHFEDFELAEIFSLAVDQFHIKEKDPRREAVSPPGRLKRRFLFLFWFHRTQFLHGKIIQEASDLPDLHPIKHPINNNSRHGHIEPDRESDLGDFDMAVELAFERAVKRDERQRRHDDGKKRMGNQNRKINGPDPADACEMRGAVKKMISQIRNEK